ncbi:MAG: gamma-glutamyltranspeptidase/glutathione hydrolase [Gammaproteobacteria bacterium]
MPGALAGWCRALDQYGTLDLQDVLAPSIHIAERGFVVTPYLADCITDNIDELRQDPGLAALFLPAGTPLRAGTRLVQSEYAETLRHIAREGAAALHGGALGSALIGGIMTASDWQSFRVEDREPICSTYRGYEVLGPPPPASAGVHIAQMRNLLEGYDVGAMGFGSPESVHLLAEVLKIAFADRAVATADPAFVEVPVARLISKDCARERRALIDPGQTQNWQSGVYGDSHSTTHVTVADDLGNVVASTQTINGLFGAFVQVPDTGMIANNYMYSVDPHPGLALSVEPGKRVFTSMAPMMVCSEGRIRYALGLPGAPRIWTEGGVVEIEERFPQAVEDGLTERGHKVVRSSRIAGGMNAIAFEDDGTMTGAACWRADGTPVGIASGLARARVRFSTM